MKIDVRFWDKANKRMIYGAGLSPNQLPIIQHEDGRLEELVGEYYPMLNTGLRATNGAIYSGDICECDIMITAFEGLPPSYIKGVGVMQFNTAKGAFILNVKQDNPEFAGQEFQVTNSTVIGDIYSSPELLTDNRQHNETA